MMLMKLRNKSFYSNGQDYSEENTLKEVNSSSIMCTPEIIFSGLI
jgi:hypothetical protein